MRFLDGLFSLLSGMGSTSDPRVQSGFAFAPLTPHQIESAYRGSGMMRKCINIPAWDMIRERRDWQAETDEIEAIEKAEKRLGLWQTLYQAEVIRALCGGVIVMGLPGDPDTPVTTFGPDDLRYLRVFPRYSVQLGALEDDPGSDNFGEPRFFRITHSGGQEAFDPSRVIPLKGEPLPMLMTSMTSDDAYWGESRVAALVEAVKDADGAHQGFSALIKKARLTRVGVPGLFDLTADAEGEATMKRRFEAAAMSESLFNWTLYDAGDGDGKGGESITDVQVTWTGMPDILTAFDQRLAAVADIPMTRLVGRSPGGMNATGDSDNRNWNKQVRARQELYLRPVLERIDAALVPTALGRPADSEWWQFSPLDGLTEAEEATRFKTVMEAAEKVQNTGAIPETAFAKALQTTLDENGWMPGLGAALAEIPEDERYGMAQGGFDPAAPDPSALQATQFGNGGKEADPTSPTTRGAGGSRDPARAANDAAPRTLYVSRPVVNVAELQRWATAQGLGQLQPDLHVTLAYSRTPIDWMKVESEDWNQEADGTITIPPGGVRIVEPLGDRTAVLLFTSSRLTWRHEQIKRAGASWDFEDYQPHVSLTGEPVDLASVEPYRGKIVLGPERFDEVKA